MFTGTTIDDLIKVVEKTEQRMRGRAAEAAWAVTPRLEVYPAYSTFVYQWPALGQAAGAA
jgi:hypothetical protein